MTALDALEISNKHALAANADARIDLPCSRLLDLIERVRAGQAIAKYANHTSECELSPCTCGLRELWVTLTSRTDTPQEAE